VTAAGGEEGSAAVTGALIVARQYASTDRKKHACQGLEPVKTIARSS
jgi:hypothetical protein